MRCLVHLRDTQNIQIYGYCKTIYNFSVKRGKMKKEDVKNAGLF